MLVKGRTGIHTLAYVEKFLDSSFFFARTSCPMFGVCLNTIGGGICDSHV
jgi:hypothetical protein